jgi:hypothetical protein
MRECPKCHCPTEIVGWNKDDPILSCGHTEREPTKDEIFEQAEKDLDEAIARIMKEDGCSEEEAYDKYIGFPVAELKNMDIPPVTEDELPWVFDIDHIADCFGKM